MIVILASPFRGAHSPRPGNSQSHTVFCMPCVCSQAEQPGLVQQLHQQQHGKPETLPPAQPHCGAATGPDQTAHDPGHHHQALWVGIVRACAHAQFEHTNCFFNV